MRADTEADGKDGFQIVVFDFTGDLPCAFQSNYSEFPNSWIRFKFTFGIDTLEVFIDGGNRNLEQIRHHCLG